MNDTLTADIIYVVTGPHGFTETFGKHTVQTLVALGLVQHVRDGHVIVDGDGNGVGALHRYYGPRSAA